MIGEQGSPALARDRAQVPEDTVEFELTAEQQAELRRAAGVLPGPATAAVAPGQPASPGYDAYICRRTDRIDRVCTIAFAALVLGLTVAGGWRAMGVAPPPAPRVAKIAPISTLVASVQPQPAGMQVVNPFDSSEVFELPANTPESEARAAIAKLLLQRASERLRQGFDVHRIANRRTHASASNPLDVFVTRLSGPENRIGGLAGLNSERAATD